MNFEFIIPRHFENELLLLPEDVLDVFDKKLSLLQTNPRHPSLRSHAVGITSKDITIWSSSINMAYRFTWEYGPGKNQITLRHIGKHTIYKNP